MSWEEEFFWLTWQIFYVAGMIFLFAFLPIVIPLFWKKLMPRTARVLFWAARRKTPPLLLVHDSGRGELTTIRERRGEGIVVTKEGKYKILPRVMPRIPLEHQVKKAMGEAGLGSVSSPVQTEESPSQITEGDLAVSMEKEEESNSILSIDLGKLKSEFILDYSDWILKRCTLVGMNLPFFVGYTGKLCLLNPEALALYEMGEMKIKTEDKTLFNPNKVEGKTMAEAMQPLLLLDSRKIQQIIYEGFDQSQIAGVVADSEEIARLGKGISKKTIAVMTIIIIVIVALAALYFLPSILGTPPVG